MNLEAYDLDSLRGLVRDLQRENRLLKEELRKAGIPFGKVDIFDYSEDDGEEYDPDIVITDIQMPVMGGIELANRIVEENYSCKIVFLTGYGDFEYVKAAFHVRAVDFILKPFTVEEVEQSMERVKQEIEKNRAEKNSKVLAVNEFFSAVISGSIPEERLEEYCRILFGESSDEMKFMAAAVYIHMDEQQAKDLKETFSLPAIVINDATAAAVAEHCYGDLSDRDVVLTLGTGLGSALVKPGVLDCDCVEDLHLGHIVLHKDGYVCKCGNKGCAEQYVSASALKRDSGQNDISLVFTDKRYAKVKADFFDNMHRVIKYAVEKYSPDNVVIGGGVVEIKNLWWNDFVALCGDCAPSVLRPAALANKAGVLGAAYSAMCGKFRNQ